MLTEEKQVKVKKEIVDKIEQFIRKHPEYGYRSISDFIEDSVNNGLKKIKRLFYIYTIVFSSVLCILTYLILFS